MIIEKDFFLLVVNKCICPTFHSFFLSSFYKSFFSSLPLSFPSSFSPVVTNPSFYPFCLPFFLPSFLTINILSRLAVFGKLLMYKRENTLSNVSLLGNNQLLGVNRDSALHQQHTKHKPSFVCCIFNIIQEKHAQGFFRPVSVNNLFCWDKLRQRNFRSNYYSLEIFLHNWIAVKSEDIAWGNGCSPEYVIYIYIYIFLLYPRKSPGFSTMHEYIYWLQWEGKKKAFTPNHSSHVRHMCAPLHWSCNVANEFSADHMGPYRKMAHFNLVIWPETNVDILALIASLPLLYPKNNNRLDDSFFFFSMQTFDTDIDFQPNIQLWQMPSLSLKV